MNVTIKDVAKAAKVSVATVSKVLNNYTDISEKTRSKVMRVVDDLRYQPNANARSLTTRNTWSIGVFFTDHLNTGLKHSFFREVIHSFKETVGSHGFDLVFFANTKWGYSFSYAERCMNRNVDGVVMMGMPETDEYLQALLDSEIPAMFVDLPITGAKAGYVTSNNQIGAEQAVEYLVKLGHRRIGTIIGQDSTIASQERFQGYRRVLEKYGIPVEEQLVQSGCFNQAGGAAAFRELMALEDLPTAIFCQSDNMAIGALFEAKKMGIRVPEDVSLIGFDDIEVASYVTPSLTTIRQDTVGMGQLAANSLVKMINGELDSPATFIIDTELVVRESCAPI